MHYARWKRHGDPLVILPTGLPRQDPRCSVIEHGKRCKKPSLARGYCDTHYARWRKHDDPLIVLPTGPQRRTAAEKEVSQREGRFQRNYGISYTDYLAMCDAQGGRCALCREVPKRRRLRNDGTPWAGLLVDHDHGDGRVRGLLCMGCNIAMGRVDKVSVDAIVAYLA